MRGTVIASIIAGLARANVTDRAMTLAGQAFTSILPVMILMTQMPGDGVIERSMDRISRQWLELDPSSPIAMDAPSGASFGILGALMTIISATSFSRALDRMYADVWGTPKLGVAGWWRWPLVIAIFIIGIAVEVFVIRSWTFARFPLIATIASFALWAVLWAGLTRLLTARHLTGRQVLATGGAAGLVVSLFFLATTIGYGAILAGAEANFGVLGVVFSVIGWLFVYSWLVVAAVVVTHAVTTWKPLSAGTAESSPAGAAEPPPRAGVDA